MSSSDNTAPFSGLSALAPVFTPSSIVSEQVFARTVEAIAFLCQPRQGFPDREDNVGAYNFRKNGNDVKARIHEQFYSFALCSSRGPTSGLAAKYFGPGVSTPADVTGLSDLISAKETSPGVFVYAYNTPQKPMRKPKAGGGKQPQKPRGTGGGKA